MEKEKEIKKMAEDIAEATVAGAASSKSLAIVLYDDGYRLLPPAPELREEVAKIVAKELHDGESPCESCYKLTDQIIPLFQSAQAEAVKAEREVIRYVALNYPTKTAIQIIDNIDGLRPRGGQCADNTTYKYDGPEYTR